jgi:hypothetical protein
MVDPVAATSLTTNAKVKKDSTTVQAECKLWVNLKMMIV